MSGITRTRIRPKGSPDAGYNGGNEKRRGKRLHAPLAGPTPERPGASDA